MVQEVGLEIGGIIFVPLFAFSAMPLAHTGSVSAGLLAILETRVRCKPTLADTAWPFAQSGSALHRCSPPHP